MNGSAQPPGSRRVMSTGAAVTLIAAGAILRFAVATTSTHGLNVHVVGVILMLAGVLGLLLSMLVWGPMNRRDRRVYQDQRPAADDRRVYQDQPPA